MIRINQLKLDVSHTEADLSAKICKTLRIREDALLSYTIKKESLDARKKPKLYRIYTVDVLVKNEQGLKKKLRNASTVQFDRKEIVYRPAVTGTKELSHRPIIVGTGPAGLFCGYQLASMGYRPILLERGQRVEDRVKDVADFWETGILNPQSNVQFGEGGAGTFSDGKLNTLVHDKFGRHTRVLELFVKYGAPKEILYQNKPHIGTDILIEVVRGIRNAILEMGGEIRFSSQMTDLIIQGETPKISGIKVFNHTTQEQELIQTDLLVLAIGHSARDTFATLQQKGLPMEAKSFAVGVRVEHPQEMINRDQYGEDYEHLYHGQLPAAAYKLTCNLENERGVYTFCMCPGGYVVNASSESNRLAVNGMSYHDRAGKNANSAVIVTVTPNDFAANAENTEKEEDAEKTEGNVLAGMDFQRRLEEAAYREGHGKIPVQLFEDFCQNRPSKGPGSFEPQMKGAYHWGNVRSIFPDFLSEALEEGIKAFDRKLPGYAGGDTILSGVESRTSSPVRIIRDESLQSTIGGIYPCGEGAGYAGGITSAAMDGLKVAEEIAKNYRFFDISK